MSEVRHVMTVGKLKGYLAELPDDWMVAPNNVHNLALIDEQERYRGFIDFAEGFASLYVLDEDETV